MATSTRMGPLKPSALDSTTTPWKAPTSSQTGQRGRPKSTPAPKRAWTASTDGPASPPAFSAGGAWLVASGVAEVVAWVSASGGAWVAPAGTEYPKASSTPRAVSPTARLTAWLETVAAVIPSTSRPTSKGSVTGLPANWSLKEGSSIREPRPAVYVWERTANPTIWP